MFTLVAFNFLLAAPPAYAQDAAAGKANYDIYCTTCHGATGKGDGVAGAALTPKPADFSAAEFWDDTRNDEHLTKVIKEGGMAVGKSPLMAPWGGVLSDEQIAEVVAYIKTFKPAE